MGPFFRMRFHVAREKVTLGSCIVAVITHMRLSNLHIGVKYDILVMFEASLNH